MNDLPSPHLSPLIAEKEDIYAPFDNNDQDISNHNTLSSISEFDLAELLSETTITNK